MANTNAPFGFRQYRGLGSAPTYEQTTRLIKSDYTTAIYFGDPVKGVNTGYIQVGTAGAAIAGIFAGCKYVSVSQKRTVWSNYWPGTTDANGDIEAYIINDPNAQFVVQAGGTAIGIEDIGENIDFALGTGNSNTGISGAYATGAATTIGLPFRVIGLVETPPGANGTDSTSAYNQIIVAFNNVSSRDNGAGPSGI